MTQWLTGLLPWILPPLIGAVIGYVTNDIAIRMLFRPLAEKRFLGIRIPLTPGIIPKQRNDLAESIGRMVSRELVNAETLQNQIRTETFAASLTKSVSSFTENFLELKLENLKPDQENPLSRTVERIISSAVSGFIESDAFLNAVEEVAGLAVRTLYRQPVSVFLPPEGEQEVLIRRVLCAFSSGDIRAAVTRGIAAFLESELRRDEPVKVLLPPRITHELETSLRSFYPMVFEGVLEWLRGKNTHMELEIRGRFLLRDILAKLNVFQRMIVNAGQYDKRLSEKMPEIVDDLIRSIEQSGSKPDNIRRITFSTGRFLRKWLQKTPAEIEAELGIDFSEKISAVVSGVFDRLNDPATVEALTGKLQAFLATHAEVTVADLSLTVFGLDEGELIRRITAMVRTWRDSRTGGRVLPPDILRFASEFFRSRNHLRIRELIGFDGRRKEELDAFLVERIQSLLVEKLPEILESFDVQKLVVNKINSLDVESVEKLLLMVIAKHLKWINLFGALLGAFIGFFQVMMTELL